MAALSGAARSWRVAAVLALWLPLQAPAQGAGDEAVRETMASLYTALRDLLPLSVRESEWSDPKRAERVRQGLERLVLGADQLIEHAPGEARGARVLARALRADAREAAERRAAGDQERARFLVRQATEFCTGCHSQLPGEGDAAIARGFADAAAFSGISRLERAQLRVATRQLDSALDDYEAVLSSGAYAPAQLLEAITSYLQLALRVRDELPRAQQALTEFAARPDLWQQLRRDVQSWIEALGRLEAYAEREPELGDVRHLLAEAEQLTREPAGERRGLVHYVLASGLLQRYLAAHAGPTPRVAEAYWLLGLCEWRMGREYWVSRSDFFLETAIRMAPEEPFAMEAFALLEEQAVLAYSDTGYAQLPPAVAQRLAELRDLLHLPGARL